MISTIAYACILASYTQLPASADWTMVERIGPPTYHFIDVERYRFFCLNLNNPNFYPIPPNEVTRGTYMQELDQLNLPGLVANTTVENGALFLSAPVLAKYVQTGDPVQGEAKAGQQMVFTQVYHPHLPHQVHAVTLIREPG